MFQPLIGSFLPFFFVVVVVVGGRISLCSLGYPGTRSVDQAGLELIEIDLPASQVLELKAYATTTQLSVYLMVSFFGFFVYSRY